MKVKFLSYDYDDDYKDENYKHNNIIRLTQSKGRSPNSITDEPKFLIGKNTAVC